MWVDPRAPPNFPKLDVFYLPYVAPADSKILMFGFYPSILANLSVVDLKNTL
jgi:hypothetical protein